MPHQQNGLPSQSGISLYGAENPFTPGDEDDADSTDTDFDDFCYEYDQINQLHFLSDSAASAAAIRSATVFRPDLSGGKSHWR